MREVFRATAINPAISGAPRRLPSALMPPDLRRDASEQSDAALLDEEDADEGERLPSLGNITARWVVCIALFWSWATYAQPTKLPDRLPRPKGPAKYYPSGEVAAAAAHAAGHADAPLPSGHSMRWIRPGVQHTTYPVDSVDSEFGKDKSKREQQRPDRAASAGKIGRASKGQAKSARPAASAKPKPEGEAAKKRKPSKPVKASASKPNNKAQAQGS